VGMIRSTTALALAAWLLCGPGCGAGPRRDADPESHAGARERMVREQLESRGIDDERVLDAMRRVPRHEFVPPALREHAYEDRPLPIGGGQTISQPYVVAYMTQQLEPGPDDVVLEVGTGSGYQAAILGALVDRVYTIEIVPELAERARETLRRLGHDNVQVRRGDGYRGWPEAAPFDAILVAAAPDHVPQALVDQLAPGGRLILPVGDSLQELVLVTVDEDGRASRESLIDVRFVPMTGEARGGD
jgi:protein-L-isoaspartate(D-aspartate) O-methyltransferase